MTSNTISMWENHSQHPVIHLRKYCDVVEIPEQNIIKQESACCLHCNFHKQESQSTLQSNKKLNTELYRLIQQKTHRKTKQYAV